MAPIGEIYFPPLDRCFNGVYQLLSWENIFIALSQLDGVYDNASFKAFFSDPQTTDLLVHSLSPYSAPSPESKSKFETKTSAINVATSHARYDIQQIKDDALWLCKEADIDEVSALRIAVLEWQTKPIAHLLHGEGCEGLVNGKGINAVNRSQSLIVDPRSSLLAKSVTPRSSAQPINGVIGRRERLLEIYLSERRYLLKTAEYLVSGLCCGQPPSFEEGAVDQPQADTSWLKAIATKILSAWNLEGLPDGKGKRIIDSDLGFLNNVVSSLRSRLEALGRGFLWSGLEDVQESVVISWTSNQIVEMIHMMQLTLDILQISKTLLKATSILPWFRLMAEIGFLEDFEPPYPEAQNDLMTPLRSLAALISLDILRITPALKLLDESSTVGFPASDSTSITPYLLDPPAMNELNEIFIGAASLSVASPAVLAWSIITQTLREIALTTRESRETRQSFRAADKYGAIDSSDTDGAEPSSNRGASSLRRRSSTSSDTSMQTTLLEDIQDRLAITAVDEDPIAYLAKNAVSGGRVFNVMIAVAVEFCTPYGFAHRGVLGQRMRECLLELIRASVEYLEYQPDLIVATNAVLTGSEVYWQIIDRMSASDASASTKTVLEDPLLKKNLFLLALSRYPYESTPFLRICRALALEKGNSGGTSAIWLKLQELDMFTCRMPAAFSNYQAIREDEYEDFVQLTGNLEVSILSEVQGPRHSITHGRHARLDKESAQPSLGIEIPSGTQGRVLVNTKPPVVAWNHEFSALSFMGKVLQCASVTGLSVDKSSSIMSTEIVAETIGLINVMLSQIKVNSAVQSYAMAHESAESILGQASDDLGRNQDVVSVIFQIFENELYKPRNGPREEESLEVLVQCTHFTYSLLAFMPDRVWPFLGRSGLLSIGQDGTQMSNIISSQEMVIGKYEFLIGCLRLFEALVEDAVTHAVARKAPAKAVTRFGSKSNNSVGISQSTMERVLLKYEQTMIDVFESSMNWRFIIQEDRMEINYRLCSSFKNILGYCYDVDDEVDLSKKLTSALAPAAKYLLDVFLPQSKNDSSVQPLLHILSEGAMNTTTSLPTYASQYRTSQTVSALRLVSTFVQISALRQSAASELVERMFNASALLAKVYAAHESYKLPVVEVFDALVRTAGLREQQPPSLLGHLGQGNASYFLDVLSVFDQPIQNTHLSQAIWRLFSGVVSNRQQWFAIYLLTGSTPRDSLKEKLDPKAGRAEPIFNIALDSLSDIDKLEPQKALAMIEFVALAADYWPWVLATMQQHPRVLKSISESGARTGSMTKAGRGKQGVYPDYNNLQLASYTADILAMYTRYTQENNDQRFPKMIVAHLTYLIKNAIQAPSYNASLHGSLRQNFASRFPGCTLAAFKRTNIKRASLGESYYYNIEFANKMLSYESSWAGRQDDGFAAEVRRANLNLSVVEAQVNLFHSWKSLLLELSEPLGKDDKFQKIMAVAVIDSLRTNTENNLPDHIFDRLSHSRADLAFALIQQLTEVHSSEIEVKSILPVAWDAVRACDSNLGSALEGVESNYYRVLLRILYLALHINASVDSEKLGASQMDGANGRNWSQTANASAQTALEVISIIVAQGFRSLTMLLHSSPQRVHPSDFALLTAILRSCIQIPGLTRNTSHLLTSFADTQTARCASTLLSWSDQLAASSAGDPIYGEYSILFLLEMSSVPALAESLAVDGVLSYILSTNLIRKLQNRAFAPLDQPTRMYPIWAKGILPLLLNLLYAVGPPMAAEVAAALNTFPHQLARASSAFSPGLGIASKQDGSSQAYLTLAMASEAQSIALIVSILRTFREAGASAAVVVRDVEEITWDAVQVKEDVESWLQRRGALRERIVPTNEREEAMSRMKAEKDGSDNRLEERVVSELQSVVEVLSGGDS